MLLKCNTVKTAAVCNSTDETAKKQNKNHNKIQQLKRIHNQKMQARNEKQKAFSRISVLSFKQSFFPQPFLRPVISVVLESVVKQKDQVLLCFEQNAKGCLTPSEFSPGSKRKGELWTVILFRVRPWTTASLCLLKAHKSPPSRASFWCCRPPSCRTAPAFGFLPLRRRAG